MRVYMFGEEKYLKSKKWGRNGYVLLGLHPEKEATTTISC